MRQWFLSSHNNTLILLRATSWGWYGGSWSLGWYYSYQKRYCGQFPYLTNCIILSHLSCRSMDHIMMTCRHFSMEFLSWLYIAHQENQIELFGFSWYHHRLPPVTDANTDLNVVKYFTRNTVKILLLFLLCPLSIHHQSCMLAFVGPFFFEVVGPQDVAYTASWKGIGAIYRTAHWP